ncbi:hypothetical protein [Nesterenkonia sp. CF4.4]|uniref:hypothetical protein n=1 Tax=Nesterenkonia sp. CF4.4 TaxID=3373079 RepID=UPI003EE42A17
METRERNVVTEAQTHKSPKQQFWTTWRAFVGIPGVLLIAWMYFAPEELRLPYEHVTVVWLALFAVAVVAGLVRVKLSSDP